MRLQVALALVATAGSLVLPRSAVACSCAGFDETSEAVAGAITGADVVFEGHATAAAEGVAIDLWSDGYVGALRHPFSVTRYFKGSLGSDLPIFTPPDGGACGRRYPVGETYVVYARYQDGGLLMDSLCSRSRSLEHATLDLELLGTGMAPDGEASSPDIAPAVEAPGPAQAPVAEAPVAEASVAEAPGSDLAPQIEGGCGITRARQQTAAPSLLTALASIAAAISLRRRRSR
jgi:MYXO-CTERM domain-containing protein